jgi:CRISPR system Cascade subunit CasB
VPSVERRFIDLLDADPTDLPYKLRQAVSLLAANGVGLDWQLLFSHLRHWGHPDRWVQKRWARGFWSRAAAGGNAESQTPTT